MWLDDVDGRDIGRSEERPSFDGLCPAMTENDMEISDHSVGFLFRSGATKQDRTLPARRVERRQRKYEILLRRFRNVLSLFS